jgi:hypothetical protein
MKKMTIEPKTIADPLALRGEMPKAFSLITGKWKLESLWLLNQRRHFAFDHSSMGLCFSKNDITLPKTSLALCRVFVPAVARLRMLRMSPGAVLNIAPFITALLGVVR